MGKKVGRTIFGGPEQSESSSFNVNRDLITGAMAPSMGAVGQSTSAMGNLLGLNGGEAQTEGLERFAESGGMSFLRDQGNNQINSNMSAKGLLKSGATLKGLEKYGQGLGSTYLNQYMSNLKDLGGLGIGATGMAMEAGKKSKSKEEGKKEGALSMATKLASSFAGAPA